MSEGREGRKRMSVGFPRESDSLETRVEWILCCNRCFIAHLGMRSGAGLGGAKEEVAICGYHICLPGRRVQWTPMEFLG